MAGVADEITKVVLNVATERRRSEGFRSHYGISGAGHECPRNRWYSYRWADEEKFDPIRLMLFEHGRNEEEVAIQRLRQAGIKMVKNPFLAVDLGYGIMGTADGRVKGVPTDEETEYLLEIKTHSHTSFAKLKDGVKKAHPQHYTQMQLYMYGMDLKKAIYYAMNKNTDEIHIEIVEADDVHARAMLMESVEIAAAKMPPKKIKETKGFWICKSKCSFEEVCQYGREPKKTCRSCKHGSFNEDGELYCSSWEKMVPVAYQHDPETCLGEKKRYEKIEGF